VSEERATITEMAAPIFLQYHFTAGRNVARFMTELKRGRLLGMCCAACGSVHVPPRGSCTACGIALSEERILSDKATIKSFTVVHLPIPGNPIEPPFVVANLVLDGASVPVIHLVSGCDSADVRIGMRVRAVWKPAAEWEYAFENIAYFRPIDEPDVPAEDIGRLAHA